MSSLYYFNPLSIVHASTESDVKEWAKLYNLIGAAVCMNDRSGGFKQPIKQSVYSACALPQINDSFNLSYSDCCDKRAEELYELSVSTGKPLGIMWSGGIDSTMIMVSFLRKYHINDIKDRIKVIISSESKIENPEFYKKYILPNFEFLNSEYTPWLFDSSLILVTGEFNDQLFGSDLMKMYIASNGSASLSNSYNRDTIFAYINAKINDGKISNILINAIEESANRQGIIMEKISDFFWWYNFCFKWQGVYFRMYALISPKLFGNINEEWNKIHMQHFYHTDYFQQWSMNHPEVRYIMDWKHYKMEAKILIHEYDKDEDYFINKIKRASLYTLFGQRPLMDGVDDTFSPVLKINPMDWHNLDNPFN
jgi:hypothetical protein